MTLFTRGSVGLAATLATAVVVSMVPGADAAPQRSAPTTLSNAPAASIHTTSIAAKAPGAMTSRVHGTFNHGSGVVHGTFVPDRFLVKKGQAYAHGTLHSTLRRSDGSLRGRATKVVSIPIKSGSASAAKAAASCQILDLVLGPLNLNLLGLKVHLNRVVLHVTAVPGAGALLGNLLCGVAGLLDGTGLLNLLKLVNQLNRLLNVLRM